MLDRSADGFIMHAYGQHILRSVSVYDSSGLKPLLLSHTGSWWLDFDCFAV